MEVIETNRPKSHFSHIPLGPIGFRVNMLRSASGRAYLAFCSDFDKTWRESDDHRDSIAVPVWAGEEVIAVINLTWMHKVATVDQIVKSHLATLAEASREISVKLMGK